MIHSLATMAAPVLRVISKSSVSPASSQGMPILPHVNMAWKSNWMWDGSKKGTLEDVMLFEVEEFFATDVEKFNNHPEYPELFEEAYGVTKITSQDLAKALAQFARVQTSADSKYGPGAAILAEFTATEAAGYAIFNGEKGSCYHCHTAPLFTDNRLHNNGLNDDYADPKNYGHYAVTGDSADLGHIRTPTLRNVALPKAFMHDGRFSTIKEVVREYNSGVKYSFSIDPRMVKAENSLELNLTDEEIDQLVAFLHTLTDSTFINDKNLADPH